MKKVLFVVALAVMASSAVVVAIAFFLAQRADYGWDPRVAFPRFKAEHPRILFDEGHHNASTAGIEGRYWSFARTLREDGCVVERLRSPFTRGDLEHARLLVIANAAGAPKPQLFGMNLPVRTTRRRGDPAFTVAEITMIRSWVEQGGSLLLIADHAPFGEAVAGLGTALGVTMHKGFVEVPGESSDPLLFTRSNGRLGDHPITNGRGPGTAVRTVMTYTGQSLDGPPGSAVLLRLPSNAIEGVPAGDTLAECPAGPAQALAFERGRGRVVVLGEAAMITAQVDHRKRYGMNSGDNDNLALLLNIMHWLLRSA